MVHELSASRSTLGYLGVAFRPDSLASDDLQTIVKLIVIGEGQPSE